MKPEKIDILFFIEHVDREMKGTLEVKQWLEENKGLKIHVASIEFGLFQAWKNFLPKVICYPFCKKRHYAMVEMFLERDPGVICINLNYEQLLSPATELSKCPQDDFARNQLIHFVWGEHFKKYLINYGVDKSNIRIVGKPEIQFLLDMHMKEGDSIKEIIADEVHIDKSKYWVFVPFNDGAAFKDDKAIDIMVRKGGARMSDMIEAVEVTKKQVENFFNWIGLLLKERGDVVVIYRPHPGVNISNFKYMLEKNGLDKNPNFIINRAYTIKEWLCCSDICISNKSTTMVDAKTIGLRTYIFQPSLFSLRRKAEWMSKFAPIETIEMLRSALIISNNINNESEKVDYDYYIDISDNAISRWGNTICEYVTKYKEPKEIHPLKALRRGLKKCVAAEYRRFASKKQLKYKMNSSLLYDYFDVI